ncbi:pyridoxal phosphate-dependent aminotransferase family protein [Helicobacter sp. 11S02629-2]|uniref:aminotransferase class I/II-fold pyridoxal phosphate-dependent enzyme n=1 Tax=Helicobacter sp. 11S02629-2 TaxID=1476195 RepID=UPI000BA51E4F|nr:pyridoxal phosphate-dependent aminotransferase family protein [Helicobacter sp. 11S02629-2]PAF45468.1 hypothetical protein BKH40_03110 [Helicobacter sp. 11S02629-2]
MSFENHIKALKKANRFRSKRVINPKLKDLGSNDYLGLTSKKSLFKKAYKLCLKEGFSQSLKPSLQGEPRASMLVNGYYSLHKRLESYLARLHKAKACTLVGSGFLGNLSLFDTLVRKNDVLFIDEKYHASGLFVTEKLKNAYIFSHNDAYDLKLKVKEFMESNPNFKGEVFVAIEGIYSMDGDLGDVKIFEYVRAKNYYMIVDEAHSIGILGDKLLGIFEHYHLKLREKDIILGTLSKAYASYGAYILGSKDVIDFLCAKARSIIYTTSLSLFDTALALVNVKYIHKNASLLRLEIEKRQRLLESILGVRIDSLIFMFKCKDIATLLSLQKKLEKKGFFVGAIRPPTISTPSLRISLRLKTTILKGFFLDLKELSKSFSVKAA